MATMPEQETTFTVQEVRGQLKTLCERANAGHVVWFGQRGQKQFALISASHFHDVLEDASATPPIAAPYAGISAALKAGRLSAVPYPAPRRRFAVEPDNGLSFAEMAAAGAEAKPAPTRHRRAR